MDFKSLLDFDLVQCEYSFVEVIHKTAVHHLFTVFKYF